MCLAYLDWAFDAEPDTPMGKLLLVTLAKHADANGVSYPGQARLAQKTGMAERSVRRHLISLEAQGFIRRMRRTRENGSRTSDYTRLPPRGEDGGIGRWPIPEPTGQRDRVPTGQRGRLPPRPTGHSGRTYRPNRPGLPANVAAPEPLSEYLSEPPRQTPPTPPFSGARASPPVSPAPGLVFAHSSTASPGGGQADTTATQGALMTVPTRASPREPSMREQAESVLDAYNDHRGGLPEAKKLTPDRERRIKGVIKLLGSVDEARSVMAIAAMEVSRSGFWLKNGYGLDNLLARQRLVQKAETAVARGKPGVDPARAGTERIVQALKDRGLM